MNDRYNKLNITDITKNMYNSKLPLIRPSDNAFITKTSTFEKIKTLRIFRHKKRFL